MEYTNEFLARVYGAYIGCKVLMDWKGEPKEFKATYAVDKLFSTMLPDGVSFSELCKLLLTSLSEISDEDAIEVARILFTPLSTDKEIQMIEIARSKLFVPRLHKTPIIGDAYLQVYDYLRSRGYDCGYGEIPSLIDADIAIKTQQP